MSRRTVTAFVLAISVLIGYPIILKKIYPNYNPDKAGVLKTNSSKSGSSSSSGAPITNGIDEKLEAFDSKDDISFDNGQVKLLFNKKSSSIREISFPKFKGKNQNDALSFLSASHVSLGPTRVEILNSNFSVSGDESYQIQNQTRNSIESSVVLGQKLKVIKKYDFNQGYRSDLAITFENTSSEPISFEYQMVAGPSVAIRDSIDAQFIEANFYSEHDGKDSLKHLKESKLGKRVENVGRLEWIASKNRHFSIILKPEGQEEFKGVVEGLGNHQWKALLVSQKIQIPAKSSMTQNFLIYMGPNDINELTPFKLDPLVNFGKFDLISKVLIGSLELINKIFKNYGVSIIVFTFFINLILFPITRANYLSMKRMQAIQPHMSKLKEKHKDDPQRMNKETMELYKKHKVNPFGGCLPMLLQMPIFIGLYVALCKSVVLIDQKFLWISNLSEPDRIHFPFSLPVFGQEIHLLPLLVSAGMFFQQKITFVKVEGQDPTMASQQKMMTMIMPVMLGFIFYSMPSGYVLYFLVNTILMTLYQLHLKKITPDSLPSH